MAKENIALVRSAEAGADLSLKEQFIVKLDSSGNVILAAAATDGIVGVLQNYPASGQQAVYAYGGCAKVKAGGVIAIGAWVTSDGSGNAVATTNADDTVLGRYVGTAAAASGDLVEIQISIFRY